MDWKTAEAEWIGAVVLVGITNVDAGGAFLSQDQMYGCIVSVQPDQGIELELWGERSGEHFWLPPELEAFEKARPGEYRLRSTGEVVCDPDLLSNWTVQAPPDG